MNSVPVKTTQYIQSNGLCLAVYQWGKASDAHDSIVLIHGYPDSAEVWNGVAQHLSASFHVVAYDVRGTGRSDIPRQQRDYTFDVLVSDLSNVIATVSPERSVHLVGHDWGALQGWEAVLDDRLKPQIASYTALAPSIDRVGWWFKRQLQKKSVSGYFSFIKQATSSSYMAMFQLPLLPELTWYSGLHVLWPKVVGYLEKTQVSVSETQLKDATNGIGLFRANLMKSLLAPTTRKTTIPVNMLVMSKDPFVPAYLCDGMQEWVDNIMYTQVEGGHWGIVSQPSAVADNIAHYVYQQSAARHLLVSNAAVI